MPESVFKLEASHPHPEQDPLHLARFDLVDGDASGPGGPPITASTCYVWPAAHCPVGCGHCNFAAPPSVAGLDRYSVAADPRGVVDFVNGMGLWKAVLSGGGEPMTEPEFCRYFIANVDSPDLDEIELITSAHFATDPHQARRELTGLAEAWRSRSSDLAPASFTVRLSLDWFHVQRLGLDHAQHLIDLLGEDEFADIGFYIRSVLLDGDTSMEELAGRLGATLSDMDDYQRVLRLPNGRGVTVYFKNLILDGRMTQRKLNRLPVDLPDQSRAGNFSNACDPQGHHVPARIYNGPTVKHLEGLACIIEDDGAVKILEGNPPDRYPTVKSHPTWTQAIEFLYRDPLTRFLVDGGPEALAQLVEPEFPGSVAVTEDTNQLYYLTDRILSDSRRLLTATLLVLHQEGRELGASAREHVEASMRLLSGLPASIDGPGVATQTRVAEAVGRG